MTGQKYAESVLFSLSEVDALVPNLWHLEAANVLLSAEKMGNTTLGEVERFIAQLENLPLHVDPLTSSQSFHRTMAISRAYKLSSYDAAYLELSVRESLRIATLYKSLAKAAKKADVSIYFKD